MNKPMSSKAIFGEALGLNEDVLDRLLTLAQRINVDPNTGTLKITNGKANISLHEDGEIRVSGTRIVQTSEQDITLDAAWIDLN